MRAAREIQEKCFLLAGVPGFHVLLWVHVLPPQSFPLNAAELGVKSLPCLWLQTNGSRLAKKQGRTWWRGCPSNHYNIVIKPFGMTWMYSSLAVAKQRRGLPFLRRTLQNSFLAVAEIWVEMCGYFSIVSLAGTKLACPDERFLLEFIKWNTFWPIVTTANFLTLVALSRADFLPGREGYSVHKMPSVVRGEIAVQESHEAGVSEEGTGWKKERSGLT